MPTTTLTVVPRPNWALVIEKFAPSTRRPCRVQIRHSQDWKRLVFDGEARADVSPERNKNSLHGATISRLAPLSRRSSALGAPATFMSVTPNGDAGVSRSTQFSRIVRFKSRTTSVK